MPKKPPLTSRRSVHLRMLATALAVAQVLGLVLRKVLKRLGRR